MTEGTTGSTVPRRQLGRYLRNRSRLTVRAAATELERGWWHSPLCQDHLRQVEVRGSQLEGVIGDPGACQRRSAVVLPPAVRQRSVAASDAAAVQLGVQAADRRRNENARFHDLDTFSPFRERLR